MTQDPNVLLSLLQNHAGQILSAEVICERLQIQTPDLGASIARLRERGHLINWHPESSGYSFNRGLDELKPQDIQAFLKTSFIGQDVHYFAELDSSTRKAFQLAECYPNAEEAVTPLRRSPCLVEKRDNMEFAGNGSVIVSEIATDDAGIWPSPSTGLNLYASVVLRPGILPSRAPQIALVAIVALARTLDTVSSIRSLFQWPDTLAAEGKVLAKVNIKMHSNIEKIHFLILGFEVNLNGSLTDLAQPQAERVTSLRMLSGKTVNRAFFAATLFKELEKSYVTYVNKGPEKIIRELNHYYSHKTSEISVHSCGKEYRGFVEGFDVEGILLLRGKDGVLHRIPAGNLSLDPVTL